MPSRTIINMGKDNSNTRKRDFDRRARKLFKLFKLFNIFVKNYVSSLFKVLFIIFN